MEKDLKDFDKWNELKKKLHAREEKFCFTNVKFGGVRLALTLVLKKMVKIKCSKGQF